MMHSCMVQDQYLRTTIKWLPIPRSHSPSMRYDINKQKCIPAEFEYFDLENKREAFLFQGSHACMIWWMKSNYCKYCSVAGYSNEFISWWWCDKWSICCRPFPLHSKNSFIPFCLPCYQHWTAFRIGNPMPSLQIMPRTLTKSML